MLRDQLRELHFTRVKRLHLRASAPSEKAVALFRRPHENVFVLVLRDIKIEASAILFCEA